MYINLRWKLTLRSWISKSQRNQPAKSPIKPYCRRLCWETPTCFSNIHHFSKTPPAKCSHSKFALMSRIATSINTHLFNQRIKEAAPIAFPTSTSLCPKKELHMSLLNWCRRWRTNGCIQTRTQAQTLMKNFWILREGKMWRVWGARKE